MERPGEFIITDRGMSLWGLETGSKVLEIGCGAGETTRRLVEQYGYKVDAIDTSLEMVRLAKEQGIDANIALGDGEFLEDYPSKTMDGVVMECVLSLINMPDEALHEAYCVLRDGGMLFLSDVYLKNPDPELLTALQIEAARVASKPHSHGEDSCSTDCADDHKDRPVEFRHQGAFLLEPLKQQMEEIGFEILTVEDYSDELKQYVAQSILSGSPGCSMDAYPKGSGYFLMVARKGK